MFTITLNERGVRTPAALTFEDLSEVGSGKPYTGPRYSRVSLEDGIIVLAKQAVANGSYDPRFHSLHKLEWADGGPASWAHLYWSLGKTTTLYINATSGSPMVIVRFDREEFLKQYGKEVTDGEQADRPV